MPDIPAHHAARFVAAAIELASGEHITVCTPHAPEALAALLTAAPLATVDVVTHDLRTAEAAEAVRMILPAEVRDRAAVHVGDGPGAGSATPQAVLLWPNGWEGNARIRAHIVQALSLLRTGGRLCLLAAQHRGAASLRDLMQRLCGNAHVAARGPGGLRLLAAVKQAPSASTPMDGGRDAGGGPDGEEAAGGEDGRGSVLFVEADVLGCHFVFKTAPGVFSHLTLNAGTRFSSNCWQNGSTSTWHAAAPCWTWVAATVRWASYWRRSTRTHR